MTPKQAQTKLDSFSWGAMHHPVFGLPRTFSAEMLWGVVEAYDCREDFYHEGIYQDVYAVPTKYDEFSLSTGQGEIIATAKEFAHHWNAEKMTILIARVNELAVSCFEKGTVPQSDDVDVIIADVIGKTLELHSTVAKALYNALSYFANDFIARYFSRLDKRGNH